MPTRRPFRTTMKVSMIKTKRPSTTPIRTFPQISTFNHPTTPLHTSRGWETLHPTSRNEYSLPNPYNEKGDPSFGNPEQPDQSQELIDQNESQYQPPIDSDQEKFHYQPTHHIPKTPFNKIKKLMALVGMNPSDLDTTRQNQPPIFGATNPNIGLENMPEDIGEQIYDRLSHMNPNKVSLLKHKLNGNNPAIVAHNPSADEQANHYPSMVQQANLYPSGGDQQAIQTMKCIIRIQLVFITMYKISIQHQELTSH